MSTDEDRSSPTPWLEPEAARQGWFERVSAWIVEELGRRGLRLVGSIEQPHVRSWSTVLRVPTNAGNLFFKASARTLAHEPALTESLFQWRPDCMPQVLATDWTRGWMLMVDGGPTLRSVIKQDRDLNHWHRVLRLYADLQMEMTGRVQELLALGTLDRRLSKLPEQYEALLADEPAMRVGRPDGLTSEEYGRLQQLVPAFSSLCQELASFGLPETLHHDDFHDGNIFFQSGRYIFFDWAESCVAHPFFTLVVTLRSVGYTFDMEADDPRLSDLRDRYLETWTRYLSPGRLLAAYKLADQVGRVNRALTWHRALSGLEESLREEDAEAVPGWLQEFLEVAPTQ